MTAESKAANAAATRAVIRAMFPKLYESCFDFSPPAGWLGIVQRLSERLSCDDTIRCLQVKTKFGGFRYYLAAAPPWAHEAVAIAEREAAHTCEQCGGGGATLRGTGWVSTLCEGCVE